MLTNNNYNYHYLQHDYFNCVPTLGYQQNVDFTEKKVGDLTLFSSVEYEVEMLLFRRHFPIRWPT